MLRICELEKTLSFRHFVKNKRELELFLDKLAQGLLYIGATRKNKSFSWRERKMKRKSLALLMAAITVFSAVGCGSKDAAADTTTAEPAAEETTEASDDAAAADTASDADGFYAGKTVEMIVPWAAGGGADFSAQARRNGTDPPA